MFKLCNMQQILISVSLFSLVYGFPWFQGRIPNGNRVPNPCNKGTWLGVGHLREVGGGNRNIFGQDFFQAGLRWTVNLCEMDSDGDGKTNGEELGDPKCEWYMEATHPVIFNATGHPGICEPMSSAKCLIKNLGIYCNHPNPKFGR
ncbi:temptin-like [Mytilus californianus]|uniref:temptin-like n=1 Tax=Mytilus californianus TaxID=6549 RepID=UPI0022479619|nr:temptin-like [Mytilus californianus]